MSGYYLWPSTQWSECYLQCARYHASQSVGVYHEAPHVMLIKQPDLSARRWLAFQVETPNHNIQHLLGGTSTKDTIKLAVLISQGTLYSIQQSLHHRKVAGQRYGLARAQHMSI